MLGDILRREREKQGLSIQDVSNETSIRNVYIEAIEKGDYDSLPGDVYTKGFIRNYARALNIDSDSLLQQYNSERNISAAVQPVDVAPRKEQKEENVPQRTVVVKKSRATEIAPKMEGGLFSSGQDYHERTKEKSGSKKFLALLAIMVVFLGGIYIAFSDDSTDKAKPTVKTEIAKKADKSAEKKIDGVKLTAKFTDNCWISVKSDGKILFEGVAEKGKEFTWDGKEKIEFVAGNAGSVELNWNGKSLGKLGEKGEVVERTFTKDSDGSKGATAKSAAPAPRESARPASNRGAESQPKAEKQEQQEKPAPAETKPAVAPEAPAPAAVPAVKPAK